jgi:hypothetical protein
LPPGLAADAHRVTPCHEPIAVVLHLVHSVGAGGRKTHEGGRQRFNKLETLPCVVSAGASATAEKANYGQSKLFRRAAKRSARLIIRHAQPPPVVAFAEDVTEQADLPDRADDLQFLYQGISARPFFGRPRAASGVMPKMEELRLTSVRSLAVRRPSGHVNDGGSRTRYREIDRVSEALSSASGDRFSAQV